jgi:hypothetical protein
LCLPRWGGRADNLWIRVDDLLWWTNGLYLPPLVTTSPVGTPRDEAGVLGEPNTTILFGNDRVNRGTSPSYRLSFGWWLDECQTCAIEADFLELGAKTSDFSASGDGAPILARPFYNIQRDQQAAELVSFPDVISGTVDAEARDYFQSAGIWKSWRLCGCQSCCCDQCCGCFCENLYGRRTDMFVGYRYYRLNDSLGVHESLVATDPIFSGTTFDILDSFRTYNEFHGGEIGLKTQVFRGRWSLEMLAKVAMGNTHRIVVIDGRTITTLPGLPPVTAAGGLLTAAGTNIGRYADDEFTVIPQIGLELGYQLTCCCRFHFGYNFLYWANIKRAGDQIDMVVDPRNLPPVQPEGTMHPAPQLSDNDFWAQGLNFGLEFQY